MGFCEFVAYKRQFLFIITIDDRTSLVAIVTDSRTIGPLIEIKGPISVWDWIFGLYTDQQIEKFNVPAEIVDIDQTLDAALSDPN